MSTTNNNEIFWIISYNRSASSWPNWESRFLARAQRKGFAGILKGTTQAPPMSMVIDEKNTTGKEEMKNCNSNNYAYKELLLSIHTMTDEG